MKIALPVNRKSNDTDICVSFGRTPYLMIYDMQTKQSLFFDNAAADSPGGAGIKTAQFVVDQGAEAVLTPRCGENSAQVLKAAGVKLYKTTGDSAAGEIEKFAAGNLAELSDIHPGFHGHGGR